MIPRELLPTFAFAPALMKEAVTTSVARMRSSSERTPRISTCWSCRNWPSLVSSSFDFFRVFYSQRNVDEACVVES